MMIDWFVVLTPLLLLPIALLLLFVGCSLENPGTTTYPPLRLNYTKTEALKIKGMTTVTWVLTDGAGKILGGRVEEAALVSIGGKDGSYAWDWPPLAKPGAGAVASISCRCAFMSIDPDEPIDIPGEEHDSDEPAFTLEWVQATGLNNGKPTWKLH